MDLRSRSFPFGSRNQPNYSWWKPLLEMVAAVVLTLALALAVGGVMLLFGVDPVSEKYEELFLFLSVAVEVPAVMIAVRFVGRRPVSSVFTGGRFTRPIALVGAYLLALAVAFVVLGSLSVLLFGASWKDSIAGFSATFPLQIVMILLAALGEEMAFRGVAFQAFTAWTKQPLIGAALATLLFIAVHMPSTPAAFLHYLLDGLLYLGLVWYFNSIGMAVAVHAAWNTIGSMQAYDIPGSMGSMLMQFAASALAVLTVAIVFRKTAKAQSDAAVARA